jgi:membrane protein DedA with SNARE-associated domain
MTSQFGPASLIAIARSIPLMPGIITSLMRVSVISLVGYFFGSRWDRLIHWMKRFNIAIAVVAVLVFVLGWWWRRRERTDAGEED